MDVLVCLLKVSFFAVTSSPYIPYEVDSVICRGEPHAICNVQPGGENEYARIGD